ncbi:MAG TPA: cobalamin-binding protein [Firmicutes bacterium]|jgi:methylmalonyl-CoA mutase cobalamin-binding domain/chain|nr:cobalamin-binding protein [Bacillota bacterium]
MFEPLIRAISSLEIDSATSLTKQYLSDGVPVVDIIESCRIGVEMVGKRYQDGEYFLSDLVMSEFILKEITELVEPFLPVEECGVNSISNKPQIVIGTIEGDIHDLGKNIVIFLLRSSGYSVIDLGVDVSKEKFVEAARKSGARIIGICFLLTNCTAVVKELIDTLDDEGLREKVTVIIGGYAADEQTCEYVGADYSATDTTNIIPLFDSILGVNRNRC